MTTPIARENAQSKGRRYVLEGRLRVVYVRGDVIRATCRGQGAIYRLSHDGGVWSCTCPARGRCAHLVALMLVVTTGAEA